MSWDLKISCSYIEDYYNRYETMDSIKEYMNY